jgi:hypothetical protein
LYLDIATVHLPQITLSSRERKLVKAMKESSDIAGNYPPMCEDEKIIVALVVVVTFGVIGRAAIMMPIMEHEMHKPESCATNIHEKRKTNMGKEIMSEIGGINEDGRKQGNSGF